MIAVLSATEHDYYAMPLPLATFSWSKIGVPCLVFVPNGDNKRIELAKKHCRSSWFYEFEAEEKRIPTFSQVSRLFASAIPELNTDAFCTADSDMCVFGDYFKNKEDGRIHIVGADLTPSDQYPMCYAIMPPEKWRTIFGINKSYQEHIAELINPIEGLNIRGEQWCYDQWYLKKKLDESGFEVIKHNRSNGQNQFAQNRADRDGWHFDPNNIIDAHLPRPLTDEQNFNKALELLQMKYPHDNFDWLVRYRNEYIKLL
jgi:hypothetical protein